MAERVVSAIHDPNLELSAVFDGRKEKYIPPFFSSSLQAIAFAEEIRTRIMKKRKNSVSSLLRSKEVVAVAGLRVGDKVSVTTATDRPGSMITIMSKHVQYDPDSPLIISSTNQPWP